MSKNPLQSPLASNLTKAATKKPTTWANPAAGANPSPAALKTLRRAKFHQVVKDVRSGKLTEKQGGDQLEAAGFPVKSNPFKQNPDSLASKTATGLVKIGVGLPGGLIKTGTGVVHDVTAAERAGLHKVGIPTKPGRADFSFKNSRATGAAVKDSYVQTVEHPLRDPAASLVNAFGVLSVGVGTIARAGAVSRAATVGRTAAKAAPDLATAYRALPAADRKAYDALARAGSDEALPVLDEHTAARIAHPSPQLGQLLNHDTTLAAARRDIVKGLGDGSVKPVPLKTIAKVRAAARDAGATRTGQVIRAAVKTTPPKQRTLVVPGKGGAPLKPGELGPTHPHTDVAVHPLGSKNALVNAAQRLGDRKTQRQLDKGERVGVPSPSAQKAVNMAARVSSAEAKVGRELRAGREVRDALELAPVSRLERFGRTVPAAIVAKATGGHIGRGRLLPGKLKGDRLTAAEQKAIEIAGSGRSAAEHVAANAHYREQARAGEKGYGTVRAHDVQIALARAAEAHLANPSPSLRAAIEETRGAIGGREHLLGMTPDEVAHRVGARSMEVAHGAAGRKSPLQRLDEIDARLAAKSPTLDRAITRRDQLQAAHDRLTGKGKKGGYSAVERPLTVDEAHARLHDLETEHNRALDEMAAGMFGPIDRAEVARRNVNNAKARRQEAGVTRSGRLSGASGHKYEAKPTVKAERRREVEKRIEAALARNPEHPTMLRWQERADEIARLRDALMPMPGDAIKADALGARHEFQTSQPSFDRVGGALSVANDEVARLSRLAPDAAERARLEQEAAQLHDAITAEGHRVIGQGGFYVPAKRITDTNVASTPASRSPGPTGYSPPQNLKELEHAYTGALHRSGNYRTDTTGVVAQAYRGAQRLATLQRGFDVMIRVSRPTVEEAGGEAFAIPIRQTREIPDSLRQLVQAADRGELTKDDFKALGQKDAETLIRHYFPHPEEVDRTSSTIRGTTEKVRWIDSRISGGLSRTSASAVKAGGREFDAGVFLDTLNAPLRAATLYTAPKYALNFVQALGTHVMQAGVFAPRNVQLALTLGKKLGVEDQHRIFALVGEGKARSFAADAGPMAGAIDSAATFWNGVTDKIPRTASWLHEARREGFTTPAQIHALLTDEKLQDKLVEITRRGNNEAVPYGHLTPIERALFKRAFFFYGWMRAATEWSLRFPLEHPAQAMVYAPLGEQGYDWERQQLGRVRPFLEGLVPLSGGDHPLVTDMTNLNNFSTPIEIGQAAAGMFHPSRNQAASALAGQLGPIVGAGGTLVFGKTPLGNDVPGNQSRASAALQQLESVLPPVSFNRRLQPANPDAKPTRRPSFEPGLGTAIGGYLGGAVAPRRLDKQAENAKADRDYRAAMPLEQRAVYDEQQALKQERTDAHALHAQGVLPTDRVPVQVTKAQELDTRRKLAYLAAASAAKVKPADLTVKQKALADVQVAVAAKTITRPDAARVVRAFNETAGDAELARLRTSFWSTYGLGDVLAYWHGYTKAHRAA